MLSRKITDGSIFVVFDMEWNQPFPGKTYSFEVSQLSGEIIEIGAVKYEYSNGALIYKGEFSCNVKPEKYTKIHYHVKKVTHKTNADLRTGESLEQSYKAFREFCGDDFILVGWGNSDPDMLKMNLKFFNLDYKLKCFFLDVQPIFSLFAGEKGNQRSVEFAVDYYQIVKDDTFHSAVADARYTGEIFCKIFEHNKAAEVLSVISSSSIDPDIKREYTCVGVEAKDANVAYDQVKGFYEMCPICGKTFQEKIDIFRIRKSYYGLLSCDEHGEFFARTRVKKNKNKNYYAASVLRFATQTDYFLIASKREEYDKYGVSGAPKPEKQEQDEQAKTEK